MHVLPSYCAFFLLLSEQLLKTGWVLRGREKTQQPCLLGLSAKLGSLELLHNAPVHMIILLSEMHSPPLLFASASNLFLECFHDLEHEMKW